MCNVSNFRIIIIIIVVIEDHYIRSPLVISAYSYLKPLTPKQYNYSSRKSISSRTFIRTSLSLNGSRNNHRNNNYSTNGNKLLVSKIIVIKFPYPVIALAITKLLCIEREREAVRHSLINIQTVKAYINDP